jgi:hypothetical protein
MRGSQPVLGQPGVLTVAVNSILLSIIGLSLSASSTKLPSQPIEGVKLCDAGMLKVLALEGSDTLMLKWRDKVYILKEHKSSVANVRRYETSAPSLMYLHLPEKSMLFDQQTMQPISTDCRAV